MSYSREKSAAIDAVARAVRLCQTVQADKAFCDGADVEIV